MDWNIISGKRLELPLRAEHVGTGITWPFCAEVDLKARAAITDADGDNYLVLHLIQDFDYLDRGATAPERYAWMWQHALDKMELPDGATVEIDIVEPPTGGALADHADVLIVLGQWLGAGTVSVLLTELWRRVRSENPTASEPGRLGSFSGAPPSWRDERITRDAEIFARWSVAAQYLDVDKDNGFVWMPADQLEEYLELVSESSTQEMVSFQFRAPDRTLYDVDLQQPEGMPYAVVVRIGRTRPPTDSPAEPSKRPTLARWWRTVRDAERPWARRRE